MRKEYRIQVEELNDGSVGYIPQVGSPKLQIYKRTCDIWISWSNLYLLTDDYVESSVNVKHSFFTEEIARTIINRYKKQLVDEELKKIKKTTYIKID